LVYIFKSLAGWLRARGSANRQSANASLTSPALAEPGYWGCATGEIIYTYRYDGELYADIFERPFLLFDSAKEFAARFAAGDVIIVRIKPGKPDVSVARDGDQAVVMPKIASKLFG